MKKKVNIILLIAVLGLWGTVIYKYVSHFFLKNDIIITKAENYKIDAGKRIEKDTFQLAQIPRDPFLNNSIEEKKSPPARANTEVKRAPIIEKPKKVIISTFPKVKYYGYIKSKDSSKELLLVNVDGKVLKMNINEDKGGFKIIQFTKDSIKATYNKEVKWIRRR